MALGWNEIKERAVKFSKEWEDTSNENADAKPFLVEFFNVFGISSRRVSTFEHKVKKLGEGDGYIDLLWKGNILIEMKSRGKNLDRAYQQAKDYLPGLKEYELPKYIHVSDFEYFRLYDLDENKETHFHLCDFVNNVQLFSVIAGYQKRTYKDEDPANIEGAAPKVLDISAAFPCSSLVDLYDPLTMPSVSVKAHQELDKAVDLAYRPQPFINETKRIEFLFELYDS